MKLQIRKATRKNIKLRLGLMGPTGSGKTFTALSIAEALSLTQPKARILLADTERASSERYAEGKPFDFDIVPLEPPYHPDIVGQVIKMAGGDYDVVIFDSLTHLYIGAGGLLEVVDAAGKRARGNTYAGWKEGTPVWNRMIDSILAAPLHTIVTMRSKMDYIQTERDNKKVIEKVGMGAIVRDGFEYEMDIVGDLDQENVMTITKSRMSDIAKGSFRNPGYDLGKQMLEWTQSGSEDAVYTPPPDPREHQRPIYISKIIALADKVGAIEVGGVVLSVEQLQRESMETLVSIGTKLKEQADTTADNSAA